MGSIYKITNKINNKCYIGQAQDIKTRFKNHRSNAFCKNPKNSNNLPKLYNAFRKYGLDNFKFDIISNDIENFQLDFFEKLYICLYNSTQNGYNITSGGNTQLGLKRSEETKRKISKAKQGTLTSEKAREMAKMLTGIKRTQETKDKISKAITGIKRSQETKDKLSKLRQGKLLTDEVKHKLMLKSIKYSYSIKSPDDIRYFTTNLDHFCKLFNLEPSGMGKMCRGKLKHYKGWTCIERTKLINQA